MPPGLPCAQASAATDWEGLRGVPGPALRRENFLEAAASGQSGRAPTEGVGFRDAGGPHFPDFSAAHFLWCNLQTPRRPACNASWHSPVGEISPPPRESPLRRDPEVHFESPAHPLGLRLLPGRGLPANAVTVETAAMAAPRQVPSHTVPRKPSCPTNSSFTRTPVSTVSLGSRELPVSPWQVAEPSSKNLWEQICDGRQPGLAERGGTRAAG